MAFTDVAIKYNKFNYIPYTPKETVKQTVIVETNNPTYRYIPRLINT